MNRKKIFPFSGLFLTLLFVLFLSVPVYAIDIPKPTSDFYVNDFSGILSQETKDYIMDMNLKVNEATGAQVVVVTMETLDGDDLETFATDLFRSYGIGDREKNNGVLLLVVTKDRDIRIEVGYGLEGAINDAKAGRILDNYVISYLSEGKWDEGIVNGFNAIMEEVETEYNLELENDAPVRYTGTTTESKSNTLEWGTPFLIAIVISLIVGLISGALLPEAAAYLIVPYIVILCAFFTIKYGILSAISIFIVGGVAAIFGWAVTSPDDGSSGGGYSSGRTYSSSSSSSSSSRSSYSGGGGRSGGGGASRKF